MSFGLAVTLGSEELLPSVVFLGYKNREELQHALGDNEKVVDLIAFLAELADNPDTTHTMHAVMDGLCSLLALDIECHGASGKSGEFVVLEALFTRLFHAGINYGKTLPRE